MKVGDVIWTCTPSLDHGDGYGELVKPNALKIIKIDDSGGPVHYWCHYFDEQTGEVHASGSSTICQTVNMFTNEAKATEYYIRHLHDILDHTKKEIAEMERRLTELLQEQSDSTSPSPNVRPMREFMTPEQWEAWQKRAEELNDPEAHS